MSLVGMMEWKGGQRRRKGGGARGDISEYSAASKRRLRRSIWAIPWSTWIDCSFVTLTYPAVFPDARRAKADLRTWFKRVERRIDKKAWAIWALELQERGAPHFHLLIRWTPKEGMNDWRVMQRWLSDSWFEVVGSGDEKHRRAGTSMERVRSAKVLGEYVSKPGSRITNELAKDLQRPDEKQGRFWGILGRKHYTASRSVMPLRFTKEQSWKAWLEVQRDWERIFGLERNEDIEPLPQWTENEDIIQAAIESHQDTARRQDQEDLVTKGRQMKMNLRQSEERWRPPAAGARSAVRAGWDDGGWDDGTWEDGSPG